MFCWRSQLALEDLGDLGIDLGERRGLEVLGQRSRLPSLLDPCDLADAALVAATLELRRQEALDDRPGIALPEPAAGERQHVGVVVAAARSSASSGSWAFTARTPSTLLATIETPDPGAADEHRPLGLASRPAAPPPRRTSGSRSTPPSRSRRRPPRARPPPASARPSASARSRRGRIRSRSSSGRGYAWRPMADEDVELVRQGFEALSEGGAEALIPADPPRVRVHDPGRRSPPSRTPTRAPRACAATSTPSTTRWMRSASSPAGSRTSARAWCWRRASSAPAAARPESRPSRDVVLVWEVRDRKVARLWVFASEDEARATFAR